MPISLNIIDILCLLSYSGGIDLGIVHSCMYP